MGSLLKFKNTLLLAEDADYFEMLRECNLAQGPHPFSVKSQRIKVSAFVGHVTSVTTVTTLQLCKDNE